MAKTKAQASKVPASRPHRASRQESAERWTRTLVIGGVVAVILLVVGVIGFGWYQTHVRPLNKTVLQVGNTKYNLGALERRMRSTLKDNPSLKQQTQFLRQLPDIALAQLQRDAKLLEGSGQLNVTVTQEELSAEIRSRASLAADVAPDVYATEYRKLVEDSGLHESEYEQMVRASLLDTKVSNYFTFYAPGEEPQVRGNYIIFDDQTKAEQALLRLQAGEDVTTVATDLSAGAANGQPVTVVDWSPRVDLSVTPTPVQDFWFGAQPSQLSGVINGGSLFYIAQLLERDDHRALDDAGKKQVGHRELNKWLDGLNAVLTIKTNLSQADSTRALMDVGVI